MNASLYCLFRMKKLVKTPQKLTISNSSALSDPSSCDHDTVAYVDCFGSSTETGFEGVEAEEDGTLQLSECFELSTSDCKRTTSQQSQFESASPSTIAGDSSDETSEGENEAVSAVSEHKLYTGSPVSTTATLSLLSKLIDRHSLSKRAVSDILRVVSALLPEQPDVLRSTYLFEKALSNLTYESTGIVEHHICPCCKALMELHNECPSDGCPYDGVSGPLSFFELPVENQMQTLFAGKRCG